MTVYGFDVKDRGKDNGAGETEAGSQLVGVQWQGDVNQEQRRQRAAQFLASVDVSLTARKRRRSSGVMW